MRVCFWSRDGKGHTLGFVVDTSVLCNGTMSRSNSICNRDNSWCLDHVHFYSFFFTWRALDMLDCLGALVICVLSMRFEKRICEHIMCFSLLI